MCTLNKIFSIIYSQTTEQQAIGIRLMFWRKVVIVEKTHSEDSVVDTYAHVGNRQTGYHLQGIITQKLY